MLVHILVITQWEFQTARYLENSPVSDSVEEKEKVNIKHTVVNSFFIIPALLQSLSQFAI